MAKKTLKPRDVGGRVKAAPLCKERGWGKETVLQSKCWQEYRQISSIDPFGVEVRRWLANGFLGSREIVKTFPADVTKTGETPRPLFAGP